jgi:hypothetical protein
MSHLACYISANERSETHNIRNSALADTVLLRGAAWIRIIAAKRTKPAIRQVIIADLEFNFVIAFDS